MENIKTMPTKKITESELRSIIKENVEKVLSESELSEGFMDYLKGSGKNIGGKLNNGYNKAKNAIVNAYDNASNFVKDAHQAGMQASRKADITKGVEKYITMLYQNGGLSQGVYNNVMNAIKKYDGTVKSPRIARPKKKTVPPQNQQPPQQ